MRPLCLCFAELGARSAALSPSREISDTSTGKRVPKMKSAGSRSGPWPCDLGVAISRLGSLIAPLRPPQAADCFTDLSPDCSERRRAAARGRHTQGSALTELPSAWCLLAQHSCGPFALHSSSIVGRALILCLVLAPGSRCCGAGLPSSLAQTSFEAR